MFKTSILLVTAPGFEKEKIFMKFSQSRKNSIQKYLFGLILISMGLYTYFFKPPEFIIPDILALIFLLLGLGFLIRSEIKRMKSHYYITQYRIVEVLGILKKRTHTLQISQIESTRVHQNFVNRLLNVGDIEIKTARESLTLYNVGDPKKIEGILLGELNKTMRLPQIKEYKR